MIEQALVHQLHRIHGLARLPAGELSAARQTPEVLCHLVRGQLRQGLGCHGLQQLLHPTHVPELNLLGDVLAGQKGQVPVPV